MNPDSEILIAACGLTCSDCPAWKATQANDPVAIEAVAEMWRKAHGPDITAEHVWCNGCFGPGPHHCGYSSMCKIRACVVEHGFTTCAPCPDFACAELDAFFKMVPNARATLEGLRAQQA